MEPRGDEDSSAAATASKPLGVGRHRRAEVLWEYKQAGGDGEVVDDLVVVRNQQAVFREVVEQYLRTITYRDGRVAVNALATA